MKLISQVALNSAKGINKDFECRPILKFIDFKTSKE